MTHGGGDDDWQPTYPYWAISVYAWTIIAGLAASELTPFMFPAAGGWGTEAMAAFLRSEGAEGFGYWLAWAAGALLLAVPPAMLSLFLVAVSETRNLLHPPIGAAFFALWIGWLMQSFAGAAFGLVFGAVSVGGTAAMLSLGEHFARRRPSGG